MSSSAWAPGDVPPASSPRRRHSRGTGEARGGCPCRPSPSGRDWVQFSDAYGDPNSGVALPNREKRANHPGLPRPHHLSGPDPCSHTIANVKAGLDAARREGAPERGRAGQLCALRERYTRTDEELLYAAADAMREDIRRSSTAGLILQIDDPSIAESWDQVNPGRRRGLQRFTPRSAPKRLNHALRGLPG